VSKTLIILNPHAASGRAGQMWKKIEPQLWERLGELVIAVTQHPEEVAQHLDKAYASGLTRVISIGGDGTNNSLVNALARLNQQHPDGPPMVYGQLPIGTGRDWARSRGIPLDIPQATEWIASASPRPTDVGLVQFHEQGRQQYFLNIASTGMGGDVDTRLQRIRQRRPWTYLKATVESILTYRPERTRIRLDGELWYDERALAAIIANGSTFAHGMKIAPNAITSDGLFDVIVIEAMSRLRVLAALRRVYDGSHLQHPGVHFKRARQVQIDGSGLMGMDIDGELAHGEQLSFQIQPGLLHLL
jgi:YegS/Rv2252/BmrU family lipid kinase